MPELLWELANLSVPNRLSPLSTRIHAGCTAILGASGSGKSSLMQVLAGFLQPRGGNLVKRETAAWMPQDLGLWPGCTVEEHLRAASNDPRRVRNWLGALGLESVATKRPAELSGGEQARCSLARALVSPANTLLLDEALAHIGTQQAETYWDLILDHVRREKRSLVFIDHQPERVLRAGGEVLCLEEGRLVYQGSVSDLYEHPPSAALMSCLGAGLWLDETQAKRWGPLPAGALRPQHVRFAIDPQGPLFIVSCYAIGPLWRVELRDRLDDSTLTLCSSQRAPIGSGCCLCSSGADA